MSEENKKPVTTKRITADAFLEAFRKQWTKAWGNPEEKRYIQTKYSNPTSWTDYMVKNDCSVLKRVKEEIAANLGIEGLYYKKEYYTVDALYVSGDSLLKHGEYPPNVHVLIEHENGENVGEEMWKLLHWRAPLKVLIFYDWNEDQKSGSDDKNKWLTDKKAELELMYGQVVMNNPEHSDTEYLVLVGNRKASNETSEIRWWAFTFEDGVRLKPQQIPL